MIERVLNEARHKLRREFPFASKYEISGMVEKLKNELTCNECESDLCNGGTSLTPFKLWVLGGNIHFASRFDPMRRISYILTGGCGFKPLNLFPKVFLIVDFV